MSLLKINILINFTIFNNLLIVISYDKEGILTFR